MDSGEATPPTAEKPSNLEQTKIGGCNFASTSAMLDEALQKKRRFFKVELAASVTSQVPPE